jgi:starch synthase (maltosyl-transferring)
MAERRSLQDTNAAPPRPTAARRPKAGAAQPSPAPPIESSARPPDPVLALRVIVERITPEVDGGRFPIKRTLDEEVVVSADVFADGHDVIVAVLRYRKAVTTERTEDTERSDAPEKTTRSGAPDPEDSVGSVSAVVDPDQWQEAPMTLVAPGSDRYAGRFIVDALGWYEYTVIGWADRFQTWRRDVRVKAAAGQDVAVELLEGSLLVRDAAARAGGEDGEWLLAQADVLAGAAPVADRVAAGIGDELSARMLSYADRSQATMAEPLPVWVDRERARFGSWYEMFPRSAGPDPTRSATFLEAARRLTGIADMGFDVLYLPPIHPIGRSFRKGPNNSLVSGPDDPGSPWAIGSAEGGHTAIEPGLGTLEDFEQFRCEAERLGLEIALDLAWQCSPDHPWVAEHPEWFRQRPDGTIKYAENPPKKYQDIYPLDFACPDWRGLWSALLDVTQFWIERGVRIFRVDNPHTKSFGFWEWLIDEVHARDPRVIFLAEAFTRPKLMRYLAKAGFTQSYTYFTWRNTKAEIEAYFTELTTTEMQEYFRPNLFANTPDILHAYLVDGGRPAFETRLVLAGTLGATYGIYSGFELCDNRAVPGTEEYADSEKYQIRKWDWNRPGHIGELVTRVNQVRRAHPALQANGSLRFHQTDNPQIIAYSKTSPDGRDVILVVVNLDPHHLQHGFVRITSDLLGPLASDPASAYTLHDLLTDTRYAWRGDSNYVRFDPDVRQAHILHLPHG